MKFTNALVVKLVDTKDLKSKSIYKSVNKHNHNHQIFNYEKNVKYS